MATKTLCPYCGVGCGLEIAPTGKIDDQGRDRWKVTGDRQHPSSQGMVCVKGATVAEAMDTDRLLSPMVRERLDEPFQAISWDQAFDLIGDRLRHVLAHQGPGGICMYGSGQFQTEDYYVAQKLLKGCLGSNNFDANSRLCMSSAVAGYLQSFGSDGPPCCYEDLDLTDCAFIIGSNAAECHPIVFNRLQRHLKKDPKARLIVVDPRATPTAQAADLHLAIQPGTDIDLLHGIAHLLLREDRVDYAFVAQHTEGFAAYGELVKAYPPEVVAERCGIAIGDLKTAAQWWGQSDRVLSLWSMGINQSVQGTAKVSSIINLHLLTGQISKPGAGPFSLTGQPNAMGGREAGGLAQLLPGYRLVSNPDHRRQVEQVWQLPQGSIQDQPGRDIWAMIQALERDEVGLFWIAATNPAVSLPDLERVKKALGRSPFTIYQDAYHPTETAAYAHLLLPAAQWGEKLGTMTNSERMITLCQPCRHPPGEARPDWEIFAEVGRRLGFGSHFAFASSGEVHAELAQLTAGRVCDRSGLNYEILAAGPQQWPYSGPEDRDVQNKRLYGDRLFPTPSGRARFIAVHSTGTAEPPDRQYPLILTVGRLYGHWHTQTRTGRIAKIQKMHPRPELEIHPRDACPLNLESGDWVEVRSRRGMARFPVLVTPAIAPGVVFVPMHWGALWGENMEANSLTHPQACPISKEPELKACAVFLTKLSPPPAARCDPQALPMDGD